MPLFDPLNPRSEEPAALYQCRSLISATSRAQELLEVGTSAAALALIHPGPADEPEDGEAFTIPEMQTKHAWGQLRPHSEVDSLLLSRSKAVNSVCEKEGFFLLHWHREVRDSEYLAVGGRADVFMYFLDVTAAIGEQLLAAADLNLSVSQVKRHRGPFFNPQQDWPSQSRFIWTDFVIAWGGSENAE